MLLVAVHCFGLLFLVAVAGVVATVAVDVVENVAIAVTVVAVAVAVAAVVADGVDVAGVAVDDADACFTTGAHVTHVDYCC